MDTKPGFRYLKTGHMGASRCPMPDARWTATPIAAGPAMSQVTVEDLQKFAESVPFLRELGLQIVAVEAGVCRGRVPYRPQFAQSYNLIHGGVTAAFADTMSYMAHATLNGITKDAVTTNLTVTYLRAAGEETLNAEARVLKNGRKVVYGDVMITCDDGTPVAHATVTYLRLDYEPLR